MLACILIGSPPASVPLASDAFERLLAVSPIVEQTSEGFVLDLRGLRHLSESPARLFERVRCALAPLVPQGMALASQRFTAEVAARSGRVVAVAPGEEAWFLSELPLDVLPLPQSFAQRLHALGIRTLGAFASLPTPSVEARFGPEGVALQRWARGRDDRGLLPRRPPIRYAARHEFEEACVDMAELREVLEHLVEGVVADLGRAAQGVTRLRLQLVLDPIEPEPGGPPRPEPMGPPPRALAYELAPPQAEDRGALLSELVLLRVEREPPPCPVLALRLDVLRHEGMVAHQADLFGAIAREPGRDREVVARLNELFGADAVSSPSARDDHRVERRWALAERGARPARGPARARAARAALRLLDVPEELVPLVAGGRLEGFRRRRRCLLVQRITGPRRLAGAWWDEPYERDEYDVQTQEGQLLRVCHDRQQRRWYLLAETD